MVDEAVVERLLVQLEEYFRDLEEARSQYSLADFKKNKITSRYTERTLQVAIEACLALASHIISYEGFREPLDNKDCFQVLLESGIIPADLNERLKKISKVKVSFHGE